MELPGDGGSNLKSTMITLKWKIITEINGVLNRFPSIFHSDDVDEKTAEVLGYRNALIT